MKKLIGGFICWIRKRHVWGRAFIGSKKCKRCGFIALVKRRAKVTRQRKAARGGK